jgi:predicted nucleic acid-binding protein
LNDAVIIDANVLIAVAVARDPDHDRCVEALGNARSRRVVPTLCVAEACYFVNRYLGPLVEAQFIESLAEFEVIAPDGREWLRIAELVRQYADFPLGATDASVIVLAERLDTDVILTLDRRHFGAVRPGHRESLRILPE